MVGGGVGGGVQYVASPVSKSKEEMKMLTPQQKLQAWRKEQEQLLAKRMEVVQLLVYNYFVPHPKDASRLAFRKEVCTETLSDAFFSVPRSMEEALAKARLTRWAGRAGAAVGVCMTLGTAEHGPFPPR